jgi:WD40 repeat protein
LAFSPDGQLLATLGEEEAPTFWDIASGKERQLGPGHTAGVAAVDVSPNGQQLITGAGDGKALLWDTSGRKILSTLCLGSAVRSIAYAPEAAQGAIGTRDGKITVWDFAARQPPLPIKGHAASVLFLAYGAKGAVLVSGGDDKTVACWEAARGKETARLKVGAVLTALAASPVDRQLALGSLERLVVYDYPAWKEKWSISLRKGRDVVSGVAYSPDGRLLAVASSAGLSTVVVYESGSGKQVCELGYPLSGAGSFEKVCFLPRSTLLAATTSTGAIVIRDYRRAEVVSVVRPEAGRTNAAAASANGQLLFTAHSDTTVRVWQIITRSERKPN